MKKGKMEKARLDKKVLVISSIILLLFVCFFVTNRFEKSDISDNIGKSGGQSQVTNIGAQVQIPLLSNEQINILSQTILSSEFINDIPNNGAIALQFYDFVDGQRVWPSGFLIGKNGFLSEGKPDIVLIMHSKYITQLDGTNLCEVIKSAQTNGEMWVETEQSNARLFLKYAGMIKYRDCFGF